MSNGEIVIFYAIENTSFQLNVKIEDDTVWLTQAQMAELFQTTRNNITLHIANVFKEKELEQGSVCKESLLTAQDGKNYKTNFYNLDVIISVGYRVKSQRGTQFRIWANKVLKEYLLKGYAISHRVERLENKVYSLEQKTNEFDLLIKTSLPPHEGIFYDGQIFDAYSFVSKLIRSAKKSIILIDNYIDESVLTLLSKRKSGVKAVIYTKKLTKQLLLDIEKFNNQYEPVELIEFSKSHDRFLIIDKQVVYHIGASLKDLGKKWFAFSKIELNAEEIIAKLNNK
ncbi:MAG: DNA-binding protein [Bacteroidetes bacterium RIFOXYA12_FULL_35_11]|nr:MAG: DNA-binding protein [Bacteroidetes bacterium GWF2_35_48]OFY73943.1 MAG: DNA-binding protein [Bacteroidetes bacterium RIFOXYA12_FULL_35_11]OFY92767.1 MAG: DNA-binding protein [Bacteroidetes bacterium RIFOXYB2_FULL_35_7]OFY92945.1 MAG: DNA-binding protein [Bacteroidetes bacterium RIFOXYC12_FULL_35_7]HBX49781.1 DNA-binding protein [Bacteroidales bacterium]